MSLIVGIAVAVLFLLLVATVVTGFCVVVYLKRQAIPNQSNPEPGYNGADRPSHAMIHSNPDAAWEEVQPVTATHYIMTPSTAYGADRSSRTLIQSNPDAAWEEVRPVTATHTTS